jgi:hypothetical protein
MDSGILKVPAVRRVITGHDAKKKAKIIHDDIAPSVSTRPKRGLHDNLVHRFRSRQATDE